MDYREGNAVFIFGIYDYLTLGLMLCTSIFIGLYSAFFKKDNTVEGYLLGNRKLKVLPVAASIMASEVSSMSILTLPTDVYLYGSNMCYIILAKIFGSVMIYIMVLPVFHNMRITTVYEYLERRFNRSVRTLCSFFFTLQTIFTMPVLMCITSLSLSLVTGFNFYTVTIITGAVTTFYTAIGGIKAVVWADTIQTLFMFGGAIAVAVIGINDVGSFSAVWNKNIESNRLEVPDLRLDLTERYNFWDWTIGGGIVWIVHGSLNQGIAQRYLSVPNISSARKRMIKILIIQQINTTGLWYIKEFTSKVMAPELGMWPIIIRCLVSSSLLGIVYNIINIIVGMVLTAIFADCDPLQSGKILARDQMTPFYIMQSLKNLTGLPGLVIAAVISATISTVSTQLNSVAAIVLNDYYMTFINKNVSEKASNIVLKLTVIILGVAITMLSFFVKTFGSAFQVYIVFNGAVGGLILGTFIIGFFLPVIKSKATFLGGMAGFAVMVWIATGMNIAVVSGRLKPQTRPLSIDECERNITIVKRINNNEDVFILYRISSLWYALIGMLVTVTVSCLLSIFMERNDVSKMDRKLFTPLIYRWLPKKSTVADTEMSLLQNGK